MAVQDSEKIILSREKYPGNSLKDRPETEEDTPRVKRPKVASAKRVKKSFFKRFSDSFLEGETGHDVMTYVVHDVVIPATKSTIADLVEGAIEMMLFGGDRRGRNVSRNRGRSYVSYNDMYDRGRSGSSRGSVRRPHNVEPASRVRHDFSGVILTSRGEAEIVLTELVDLVTEYGVASVSDLYDLVGLQSEFTDNKYGWFDLDGISTARVRDGWALELPRPRVIE